MMPSPKTRNRWIRAALLTAGVAAVAFVGFRILRTDLLQQARDDAARGLTQKAVRQYLRHLDKSSDDHHARLELAELYKSFDSESALEHFQRIPSSAPEYSDAIWHVAHIAVVGQQDALAEEALLKLDKVRPDDGGVALSLAELYYRTQRYSQALPWAEKAAQQQPDRALTWLLLAEVLDHLKRPAEMLQPLKNAIERDPELYAARANLAYALHLSGHLEIAEKEARWCLTRQPDDARVRRWLAMILRDLGRYDEALEQIRLALATSPADVDCRMVEADLLVFQRQADQAYEALKPLYHAHSGRRDYLSSLARAAAMSGRRDEARRYQQEIVNLIQQEPDLDPSTAPTP